MIIEELITSPIFPIILLVFVFWTLSWKGFALWKASRRNQPVWFFFLLIINSVGILPIIYLILENDTPEHDKQKKKTRSKDY